MATYVLLLKPKQDKTIKKHLHFSVMISCRERMRSFLTQLLDDDDDDEGFPRALLLLAVTLQTISLTQAPHSGGRQASSTQPFWEEETSSFFAYNQLCSPQLPLYLDDDDAGGTFTIFFK